MTNYSDVTPDYPADTEHIEPDYDTCLEMIERLNDINFNIFSNLYFIKFLNINPDYYKQDIFSVNKFESNEKAKEFFTKDNIELNNEKNEIELTLKLK